MSLAARASRVALTALLTLALASGLTMTADAAPRGRYALGDSVMLGAKPNLENRGYRVDATISRQVYDGVSVLRQRASAGTLRRNVVVHLGTNGTFSRSQCRSMRSAVGQKRRLFLVTVKVPRSWQDGNNRVIRRCAARYDNVHLVDWHRYVKRRTGLVASDGYHLTPKGARHYARLVDARVDATRG